MVQGAWSFLSVSDRPVEGKKRNIPLYFQRARNQILMTLILYRNIRPREITKFAKVNINFTHAHWLDGKA